MLNGVSGFMRGDAERSDRRRVKNVTRKAKLLLRRIVMVAEKIVRLDNIDIVDLRCLQNLPRAFRAGDVRAGADLRPFAEGATHPDLRPQTDDQWDTDVK